MTKPSVRTTLLREAVRLFNERGYRETTVGDIEEAAGLTRRAGGFYRHFKSKDDLMIQAVDSMAAEMIAGIRLDDVTSLKSIRAELLIIARALYRHAEAYRPMRLFIQREAYRLPKLHAAARRANSKLGVLDVVPWVESALKRSGIRKTDPNALGLTIFGPVLIHIYSLDRRDPAFGIKDPETFLPLWADHWVDWFERTAKARG